MEWVDCQYQKQFGKYDKMDGAKALALYIVIMGSAFFQGWLYTTNVNVFVCNTSQIWIPVLLLLLFFCFLTLAKEKIASVGIHLEHMGKSIQLGLLGGVALLALRTLFYLAQGKGVDFCKPFWMNWLIFCIAAFEEELLFRGYIQTRLFGLVQKQWLASGINAILFLSIHYPVRWVVSKGISFAVLSAEYVVLLLLLHFFCDIVYKRTNCLWGSVLLHIIYNAVGAMLVYS